MEHKGLLPSINYTTHVADNVFHKGIDAVGQVVVGLAFDLHAWLNCSQRKEEILEKMSLFSCNMLT